jgi:hypothetical protein
LWSGAILRQEIIAMEKIMLKKLWILLCVCLLGSLRSSAQPSPWDQPAFPVRVITTDTKVH